MEELQRRAEELRKEIVELEAEVENANENEDFQTAELLSQSIPAKRMQLAQLEAQIKEIKDLDKEIENLKKEIERLELEVENAREEEDFQTAELIEQSIPSKRMRLAQLENLSQDKLEVFTGEGKQTEFRIKEEKLKKEIEIAKADLEKASKEGRFNDEQAYAEYLEALESDLSDLLEEKGKQNKEKGKVIVKTNSAETKPKTKKSTDEEKKKIIDDVTKQMKDEDRNYKNINVNPVPDIPNVKLKGKDLTDEEKKKIIDDVTKQMKDEDRNYKNININPVPDVPEVKLGEDVSIKKGNQQTDFKPEEVRLQRTGLQIFRQEFMDMPEIKKRHTISENPLLPLPGSVALALATAGILTGPVGWIGAGTVAAGSYFLAKPILRAVTGENKIVKAITEQFNEMPVKDLKKMADYLSEENIIDLKPNAVVLKALNRSLRSLANRENQKLEETIAEMTQRRDKILAKAGEGKDRNEHYPFTKEEEEELKELNELIDINRKEAEDNELRSKNARRGKDRISAMYKGNVAGNKFLNVFNKRNSTTKEYMPALNEYANAEVMKIAGTAMNDPSVAAKGQAQMEEVGQKYTYKKFGLLRSPFNMKQSPARIVSDQRDNTIRNVGVAALAGASLYRTVTNMNDMAEELKNAQGNNKDVEKVNQFADQFNQKKTDLGQSMDNVTDNDIQGTGNSIVNDTFNRGEVAAMRGNGGTVSHMNEGYVADDQLTQQLGNASAEKVNGILNGGISDKLRNIGKLISGEENATVTQKLQDAVGDAHSVSGAGVDHATQFAIHENAVQYNQSHADLYEHLADVTDKAQEMMKLQPPTLRAKIINFIKPDFIGPIAAAVTSLGSTIGLGIKRNSEQKVDIDIGIEDDIEEEK